MEKSDPKSALVSSETLKVMCVFSTACVCVLGDLLFFTKLGVLLPW